MFADDTVIFFPVRYPTGRTDGMLKCAIKVNPIKTKAIAKQNDLRRRTGGTNGS